MASGATLGGLRLRSNLAPKPMGVINVPAVWKQSMARRNSGLLAYSGTLNNQL